jgi:hypothetical protein
VSIAADSIGTFSIILLVRFERISTSRGKTSLYAGINNTSSKVSPSPNNLEFAEPLSGELFLIAMGKDKRKSQKSKFKIGRMKLA